MDNKELLAVLDMSEDEQLLWVAAEVEKEPFDPKAGSRIVRLAEHAFRLRDEVIAEDDKSEIDCYWCEASYEVYLYIIGEENEMEAKEGLDTWFTMRAKPIHWIIAALIAKENHGQ